MMMVVSGSWGVEMPFKSLLGYHSMMSGISGIRGYNGGKKTSLLARVNGDAEG